MDVTGPHASWRTAKQRQGDRQVVELQTAVLRARIAALRSQSRDDRVTMEHRARGKHNVSSYRHERELVRGSNRQDMLLAVDQHRVETLLNSSRVIEAHR